MLPTVALLAALIAPAVAHPFEPRSGGGAIGVPLRAAKANDPAHILAVTAPLTKRQAGVKCTPRDVNSEDLVGVSFEYRYGVPVSVGTPPQELLLLADTGSADLAVFNSQCASCYAETPRFDSSKSSTYKTDNRPVRESYGAGDAQGVIATDTVEVAGWSIDNHNFADINNGSATKRLDVGMSGIFGLAWPNAGFLHRSAGKDGATSYILSQKEWEDKQFGIYLGRHFEGEKNDLAPPGDQIPDDGLLTLGGLNTTLFKGDVNYIELVSQGAGVPSNWSIPLTGAKVNGQDTGSATISVLIDSGAPGITLSADMVTKIHEKIEGAKLISAASQPQYIIPCNTTASVALTFGGQDYTINPTDLRSYVYRMNPHFCYSSIYSEGAGAPSIAGAAFMRNVYSAFRYEPPAVGFAQLAVDGKGNPI